ncbi:PPC domain-containing protein [Planktothrix agardhii 1806]|uniref:PPC domain-containing protein n=2 Tax=Planktothrix agardhii TaxID=1160 RepID=UPI001F2E99F2|nr:PPC domain-containing protein [Planktothrix agardhii]MCF3569017.1 PPC domain-containing protein [Planktothrix agardhii 1807]MCF3570661.1 PPC domain-containing protein [Planktothrix agardhii 1805]MCF3586293.1 PPC domain-containing protein [Planktothrix agardhii 1803]MCF3603156.1 PPC domain-containing protein [Planktothrix agardhii 1804]MCF3615936.1 PPC domain-containing protein [Planktothrix agardhii 1806]
MLIESAENSGLFPIEATQPALIPPYQGGKQSNLLIGKVELSDPLPVLLPNQYSTQNPDLIFESSPLILVGLNANLGEDQLTGITESREESPEGLTTKIAGRKAAPSDPGETIKTAKNLGQLASKPQSFNEEIGYTKSGKRDTNDYYKFTVKNRLNQVNISLDGLKGNANLQLLGTNGKEIISTSTEAGKTKENIFQSLPAGTYYLRVYPQGAESTPYHLSLDADSITDADGEPKRAQDFKLPGKIFNAKDDIGFELGGERDQKDYYELNLTKNSEVSISLDGLTQNANIKLLGKDGKNIEFSSSNLGKEREEITTTLDKGKYYVLVEPYQTERTSYNLSVAADAQIIDKDGSLPGKKLNIGKSVTDKIGVKTGKRIDQDDYYNFELKKESEITLDLQKLTQNADIELYGEDGTTQILASNNSGNKAETINSILDPGKYYVRIKNVGKDNTEYRLSLTANTKIGEADDQIPGTNLGDITKKQKVNKSSKIGFQTGKNIRDTDDYYQFQVAESSNVNISLDGLNANAKLELLGTDGQSLGSSNKKGTTAETINKKLEPGTYYVHIEPNSGKDSTAYNLKITAAQPLDDYESLKTAKKLGALNQQDPITQTNAIGFTTSGLRDKNDYYHFSLTEPNELTVDLENLKADANVRLLDASGKLLKENIQKGTKPETISKELKAGDYYLQVLPVGTAKTNYNLTVGIQQQSDLSGVFQLASTTANPEDIVDVKYTVSNTDVSDADGFRVGFYLSADSAIDPKKDTLLDSQTIKSLAGYTLTSELTQKLTLPGVNDDFWQKGKIKDFYLGMVVDDLKAIGESNEKNNLTKQLLAIAPVPADNAGNSLEKAKDLGGIGSAPQTYSDWLGNYYNIATDSDDYYKLQLTQKSNLKLDLTGLQSNADVYLLDSQGNELKQAVTSGNKSESISENLLPGDYYVRVNKSDSDRTAYNLKVSASPLEYPVPVIAGNTWETAYNMTNISSTPTTYSEFIGNKYGIPEELQDYYKLQIDKDSSLSLKLTGMSANANLFLYNSDKGLVESSETLKTAGEQILSNLTPGTYYIKVAGVGNIQTTYNLEVATTTLPNNGAGNNPDNSKELGAITTPQTVSDWVGDIDNSDYYQLSLPQVSTLELNLTNTKTNLSLYDNKGSAINSDYQTGKLVSNLQAGTYYVEVAPDYNVSSANYDLQVSATPRVDTAGNTINTAQDIGTLGATAVTKTDWVGDIDTEDYYKFSLTGNSTLNLNLSGLTQNADLYLIDSNGSDIAYSNQAGKTDESILNNLTPGTYYVRVNSNGEDTNYNLKLSATAIADGAGNDINTAQDIGALGATAVTKTDWVGDIDTEDYYKFSLTENSTLNLNLSGLTQNADLYLMDSNGSEITYSIQEGKTDESILNNLTPGTYYVRVNTSYYSNGEDTNYNLKLSATAIADGAGNDITTAKDLGAVSSVQNLTDWVGSLDQSDYYKLSLTQNSNLKLDLTGLSQDAVLYLHDSQGNQITYSNNDGKANEAIAQNLGAGLYYLQVAGSADTTYNLGVSATALTYSPANIVGNTLSQNLNIGALGTTQNFSDFVGNPHGIKQDETDYYTFSIPSASSVNLKLTGLTANADLYLYDSNGYPIVNSSDFSSVDETISQNLNAGTYIIGVLSNNSANTGYNLQATASAFPNNGAGESFDKALPLGILSSAISYDDWVGYQIDPSDYYQFQLAQNRVVNVNLSNVSDSINVDIHDNSGNSITYGSVGAGETKTLTTETLPPGLYYVTVSDYYTDKGSFYRLSIS